DPYVMAESGHLGAPDRSKAKVFCQTSILSRSRTGRQAEVISQHETLQERLPLRKALQPVGRSSHRASLAARTDPSLPYQALPFSGGSTRPHPCVALIYPQ